MVALHSLLPTIINKLNEKAFKHLENTVNGPVNDFSERTPRPPACSLRGLKAACEGALVGHAENNDQKRSGKSLVLFKFFSPNTIISFNLNFQASAGRGSVYREETF